MTAYWRFIQRHWPLLTFGFITIFWGNLGQSFFISFYGASIQQSLAISAGDYGLIYALATLSSGLMLMALGGKVDKYPLKNFSSLVALGLMAACIIMWLTSGPWWLGLGFFLLRLCGQGLMPHVGQTTMARSFDKDRGKAISLSACGVPLGEAILPLIVVALIAWLGWQQSWLWLGLSIPLIYIPLSRKLLNKAALAPPEISAANARGPQYSRRHVLKDLRFWLVLPAMLAGPFLVTAIFIQQNYVLEQKGWTTALLASSFIIYGILHWAGSIWSGVLVDRFRARKLVPFISLPLLLAMLLLTIGYGPWLAPAFMAVLGLSIGITGPVFNALWAEIYGTTNLGAIRALATSLMILSTASSPWLFGLLIDAGIKGSQLFAGCTVFVVIAGLGVFLAYGRNREC
ncbi:MFS transporter [Lacimicrobium alkaliphilum]|uniref:MFS transporter n=1 Tax=Lacimicrobium alkaliphilum TaxID=1526571 RepID=A0ABQ1RC37_9ALTE|nr:MFS transporter [Lacimicrobium alkaliphilum]GGD65528.1 MFS transporter [Lacimicrobium alkaliphilum]